MRKRFHGVEVGIYSDYQLPEGVGLYLTHQGSVQREEISFSSGITTKEMGELAGRASRLYRLMTGEDITISESEAHILQKMARASRLRARQVYDKIRAHLDDYEAQHAECLANAARREEERALRESMEALEPAV